MKRNCRRTDEERAIHERACKLRRMTDEQLCEQIDRGAVVPQEVIEKFLQSLTIRTDGGLRVTDATIRKLRIIAAAKGYLPGENE